MTSISLTSEWLITKQATCKNSHDLLIFMFDNVELNREFVTILLRVLELFSETADIPAIHQRILIESGLSKFNRFKLKSMN